MTDSLEPMKLALWQRIYVGFWRFFNKSFSWHRLPGFIGVFNLLALRYELRANNLYDTYPEHDCQGTVNDPVMDPKFLKVRNSDGMFNELSRPKMGCAGMRMGRNIPRKYATKPTDEDLLTPSPRLISEKLMKRTTFQPATIVNLLAAAWIQFQVHDWFEHERDEQDKVTIPLAAGDTWSDKNGMKISRSVPDAAIDELDRKCPAYKNVNTAWWDGSQIYGSTEKRTQELRNACPQNGKGKLKIDTEGTLDSFLPLDQDGIPETGFHENWWIGLELLHTLFALEHNSICDLLEANNPTWTSDKLFDTARLVNCALMAKIHTVEWTPAILKHPALQIGMSANWWGLIGERLHKMLGKFVKNEVITGIPGSDAEQDGAPYSLTEEFTSVYRLHPLIPDNIAFFDVKTGDHKATLPMLDVAFVNARKPMEKGNLGLGMKDAFYSFGVNYPGAIRHHNTPDFLRDLHTPAEHGIPDGRHIDMGAMDIFRDRERGVPRYNQFRRLFHMPAVESFEDLTGGDVTLAAELKEVYNNDIEKVDLQVGTLYEPLPDGFGFSDTSFRVFILMATRRLKSDRFIATQWNADTYTKQGIDWVQNSTMSNVLIRHFPDLKDTLKNVTNAFAPWTKVGTTAAYSGVETNTPKELEKIRKAAAK